MKRFLALALAGGFVLASSAAQARHHHLSHRYAHYLASRHALHVHHHHWARRLRRDDPVHVGGLTRARLPGGQTVVVSTTFADRFVGFFQDLFAREGRLPEIGCYAAHGHMPLPWGRHPVGEACDVGQSARNRAWAAMYRVGDLARKWGLTDGCWWRGNPDCGHVQINRAVAAVPALIALRAKRTPVLVRGNQGDKDAPEFTISGL